MTQREAMETDNPMTKDRKGALRERLGRREETETHLRSVPPNGRRPAQLRWLWVLTPVKGDEFAG